MLLADFVCACVRVRLRAGGWLRVSVFAFGIRDAACAAGNPSDPWPEIAWHNAAGVADRRMHNIYGLCQVVLEELAGTSAAEVQIGWVNETTTRQPTPPHPKSEV